MTTRDLALLALAAALATSPVPARATAKIYDMTAFLMEPHPWARPGESPTLQLAPRPPATQRAAARRQTAVRSAPPAPPASQGRYRPSPGLQPQSGGNGPNRGLRPVGRLSDEIRVQAADTTTLSPKGEGSLEAPRRGRIYVSGSFGFGFLSDVTNSGALLDTESEHEIGFNIAGAVGYRFANGVRGEFEIAYRQFGIDNLTVTRFGSLTGLSVGGFDAEGDASATAFMFNVAYDIPTQWKIVPHVMGGVGPAMISISDVRTLGIDVADDSDWVMAFQLGGGAGFPVTENWLVGVEYRWFATTDPSFQDAADDPFDSEFSSHNFSLFARYVF